MTADSDQREAALDPGTSFIVEAPAGSGKTGLLVQRFLRLLSTVERPESVVAMTFTRKAAAEMKERVLNALGGALNGPVPTQDYQKRTYDLARDVLQRDREKAWHLLSDSSRLQIGTIDSLCALLTRQMPVLSEFGGVGEVVEEASDLYLRAARDMLTHLAEGDEARKALFRRMVLHVDNNIGLLENQVVIMLSKRDQWRHLNPQSDHQLVQDCCALLWHAEAELRAVFQQTGKVDFTEIAHAAQRALGKPEQPSDLLYSLDYRLQHLLVDEFQDTSRSQFDLITALTEQWSMGDDHTLFLVGDPMQSIYRFREADVSLFLKCWQDERIGAVQLNRIRLETNFRTTPEILDWVQTHFAPLMKEDDVSQGAVQFRQSSAGREVKALQPTLIAHIKDDSGKQEADEIVRIVEANPGRKVAILVRSRSQTVQFLPALRKAGIRYEAIEIDVLKDQQHVMDVLSLTRAVTHLADRVAWLACLRAPWCGLTLDDLSVVVEGKPYATVLSLLSDADVIARLSVDGRWRAVRAQEILSAAVGQAGRMQLWRLVEQTWRALGGLAVVAEPNQREDIETLFRLIEHAEEGGSIRDFTLLNKRLEFLYARPAAAESNVVVMTVHQAKGLEFDVVILPGMGKKGRDSENELLVWADHDGVLEIAAKPQAGNKDPNYKRIGDILKEKENNEAFRLFYVACTRAVNDLHLIGSTGVNKRDGKLATPAKNKFLGMIWEQVKAEFESKLRQMNVVSSEAKAKKSGCLLRRLPVDWQAPAMARAVQTAAPLRRGIPSQRPVSFRWVGDSSRHVGTVVHEMLERITNEGIDRWTGNRVLGLRPFVSSELMRLGVTADQKKSASDQVLKAIMKTVSSERGRWILSPHQDAKSEWAITGRVGESLVSGTVDRAFEADGTLWIIDFKTGEHDSRDLNNFLSSEKLRYQPQLELYASVVSRLVNTPIALGLYFPMHDAWMEWRFAGALTAVR